MHLHHEVCWWTHKISYAVKKYFKDDDEISLPYSIVLDYEVGYVIFGVVMHDEADYLSSAGLD